jgi:hypothetical protein
LHKTATTTLQQEFFPACHGLNYIPRTIPDVGAFSHAVAVTDPIYFDAEAERRLLAPHIREDVPNLISEEAYSGSPYAGLIKAGLDHRSPILKNLHAALPSARIIVVIRRQDRLARSLYRQYITTGGTQKIETFYGFLGESALLPLNRFRFTPYIDMIHSLFTAGVLILVFEEFVLNQEAFLLKIVEFLGVEMPDVRLNTMNRTTLGPTGMELCRILNRVFKSKISPGGVIPGIPRLREDRMVWVSPVALLNNRWPGRGRVSKSSRQYKIGEEILERVRDDNVDLDERYKLGLAKFGYY